MDTGVGLFTRGKYWSSVPDASPGLRHVFPDNDYSTTTGVQTRLSGHDVECVLCKANTGSAILPGLLYKFDWSGGDSFREVTALCGAGEKADCVADEYLPSGGCPDLSYFWGVTRGFTKVKTANSTAIAAGDSIVPAASGKIIEDLTGNGNRIGRINVPTSAANTLYRAYVNMIGGGGEGVTIPRASTAVFTVGAEAANIINVAVQINDQNGVAVTNPYAGTYWLSTDAAGQTVSADPGTTAIGTNGTQLVEITDDVVGLVVSEAVGTIDWNITHTGTSTFYMNIAMPDRTFTSAAITFA